MTVTSTFERLGDERIDHGSMGLPPDAEGKTIGELIAERRNLFTGGFTAPVLALSAEAIDHGLALMEQNSAKYGLAFAPYSPLFSQIFQRQCAHGAWGITAAVPHQVRVYRAFGIQQIFLANTLVDAALLTWLARELSADVEFRFICYVDSVRGVELMDAALREAGAARPVEVVVELGAGKGARTGARTADQCAAVADAVAAAPTLRLVGVAGSEDDIPEADYVKVTAWLQRLIKIAADLDKADRFTDAEEIIVSMTGGTWLEAVTDVSAQFPTLSRPVVKLVRSGECATRGGQLPPTDGHPDTGVSSAPLRLWTQVVSRPEPSLAFVNTGRIETPRGMNLPATQVVRHTEGETRLLPGVTLTGIYDHQAQLKLTDMAELEVGDWIGLSLPSISASAETWPLIPLVHADGGVTDYIHNIR